MKALFVIFFIVLVILMVARLTRAAKKPDPKPELSREEIEDLTAFLRGEG